MFSNLNFLLTLINTLDLFNLIFGYHMDLLIIDSIQYGHKSIFEPLRFKISPGATPQTSPFCRSLCSLQDPPGKNSVSAPANKIKQTILRIPSPYIFYHNNNQFTYGILCLLFEIEIIIVTKIGTLDLIITLHFRVFIKP